MDAAEGEGAYGRVRVGEGWSDGGQGAWSLRMSPRGASPGIKAATD